MFDPQKHHRRSIRLPGHDYSQPGAYFITIVTREWEHLFGEIKGGEIRLNEAGHIVREVRNSRPARYPQIGLGTAQVMPNHFHGIVIINELLQRGDQMQRRRMTISLVVGYFKMNTAKQINRILGSEGIPVWQRNYYEHIIGNDEEHKSIYLYVEANVDNWSPLTKTL